MRALLALSHSEKVQPCVRADVVIHTGDGLGSHRARFLFPRVFTVQIRSGRNHILLRLQDSRFRAGFPSRGSEFCGFRLWGPAPQSAFTNSQPSPNPGLPGHMQGARGGQGGPAGLLLWPVLIHIEAGPARVLKSWQ